MAGKVKDSEEATEAVPNADEAEKIAAVIAEEARLKAEEQRAAVKAVKEAEVVAEAARKAEGGKAEMAAVIRAEEARLKPKAYERTAATKADDARREAQNSTAKATEEAAANEKNKRQVAMDKGGAPGGQDQGGIGPSCRGKLRRII